MSLKNIIDRNKKGSFGSLFLLLLIKVALK